MTTLLFFAALTTEAPFPERTPGMIEACIYAALVADNVTKERDDYKYICGGEVAQQLWDYLENAKVEASEQTTENGVWSSRYFPLGGCFKRVQNVDGSVATSGLSCTVWIPYRIPKNR
ncbi:MAG: hypothetical protein H2056_05160 [Sphingopyxis sp.]|nr:hypothetical protein [Sphingopyxis sp.]